MVPFAILAPLREASLVPTVVANVVPVAVGGSAEVSIGLVSGVVTMHTASASIDGAAHQQLACIHVGGLVCAS